MVLNFWFWAISLVSCFTYRSLYLIEAPHSPVEGIGPVIDGELILLPIHRKSPPGDPIGHPPDDGSEVLGIVKITCKETSRA